MKIGPTDGEILREIAEQEAKGVAPADAIIAAAATLGLDVDDVRDVWVIYDVSGTCG